MTQDLLFLRGINVGGSRKVAMADLKASLSELGYQSPVSYINSGNLLFHSEKEAPQIRQELTMFFTSQYDFPIFFAHSRRRLPKRSHSASSLVVGGFGAKGCLLFDGRSGQGRSMRAFSRHAFAR